ncbi:MAG TPA: TetR/AcrR family transcriptional regulator [Acetobacteraceae bacterium]|jgi:AcrR family transcriptional regulator
MVRAGTPIITARLPARGGRPSRAVSAGLADIILDAATHLFLQEGFGATSMEAVAAVSGVSKRTLYARFPDKAALLQAAVARLITAWRPEFDAALDRASSVEEALLSAARQMLAAALQPDALLLYRLIVAESGRFPDLGRVLQEAGAGDAIGRIAAILRGADCPDPIWAAGQFQRLVLTGPQHRALGVGPPLSPEDLDVWAARSVALFLRGYRG